MKTSETITKIVGAFSFLAITYGKVTGVDIHYLWLAIPAVMVAVTSQTIEKILNAVIDRIISKKLK